VVAEYPSWDEVGLKLASKLVIFSDGAKGEVLTYAFGEALEKNPTEGLESLVRIGQDNQFPGAKYLLDNACRGLPPNDGTPIDRKNDTGRLKVRASAVRALTNKELDSAKARCLKSIEGEISLLRSPR